MADANDDTGAADFGSPSNPFPVAPDPFFQPTKAKQKAATKKAVKAADPDTKRLGGGFNIGSQKQDDTLSPDEADISGKKYKFSAVDNPEGIVQDYTESEPTGDQATRQMGMIQEGNLLQQSQDPKQLSAKQYDALTKEASKGNKLAQKILVSGHYKAHDYPSLSQDMTKLEDPFVKALSGLPALAQNEQAQADKVTQPYDFTNAEAQVNNLLGQMGSSQKMTTSPETNSYLNSLQGIVSQGANNLTTSNLGLPSIMTALGALGPAAKESEKATPYQGLLASLLSHENYDIETGLSTPNSTNNPAWLQSLIAAVTGTTAGGGLVSPTVAASQASTVPSATAAPTGSTAGG